ncbi:MAG: BACON domain-containing protein [Bacteroidales bacterium]|nr:BACON domain-containing protein [Bacteroidales bacterium]
MKRFLKFFAAIVASAMTLFSCGEEEIEQILAKVAFDKASYEIGAEGGELKVKVLVTVDWTAAIAAATSLDIIDGITLPADKGKGSSEPIEIVVKFAANEGFDRTVKLSITGGGVSGSCTITQKGSAVREMEKVTVAQFLEKPEDASIYYELKGVIKSITNTDYSNFVMKDIDGEAEILIYGLAYESDVANQKVQLLVNEGIQEGDIITIASTRGSYNGTPEGMNSYYISHEKSATPMIKLDKETYEASATGEEFVLNVTSNIVTWTLSADVDWLSFDPSTGNASTAVKVTVAAGEGGTGTITLSADGLDPVTCVVTRADLTVLTIAEFLAKPDDENKAYQIGGIITNIVMDKNDDTKPNKYGNFYIKDHTGEAYIYGLLPEKGGASGQDVITEKGLKIGDFVSLAAPKSSYNDAPQGKNAWLLAAYPALSLKAFSELEDDATKSVFYTVSGTVSSIVMDKNDETKPNKYGNIYIKDAEGFELYIYGVLDWDGKTANFESLGVKVGDVITGYAYKTSYNGTIEAVNLQPVIIEEGEEPFEWDYTASASYLAEDNLWKPIFDGNVEKYFYYFCDGADWNGTDTETTDVRFLTKQASTYKILIEKATTQDWQNQFFFFPNEGHFIALDASKAYNVSITIGASMAAERGFCKLVQYKAEGPKHEGATINEWAAFALDPKNPVTLSAKIEGVTCENINFICDFGKAPAGQEIYIKDVTLTEIVPGSGIPDYDPITGFEL